MAKRVKVIKGGIAVDDRGSVRFVNDFDFKGVKRFYQVENNTKRPIRGFHGHMKEAKYVYVLTGSILLAAVTIDNFKKPSKKQSIKKIVLSAKKPQILYIPPGYAHGYKALEKNTKIIFFSTLSLSQSQKDDFRYPFDYWGKEIWELKK